MEPSKAPFAAFKNRENLTGSCGCFKCLEKFEVTEITEWTDGEQTALCPKCSNDSVIPHTENLQKIRDFWFKK